MFRLKIRLCWFKVTLDNGLLWRNDPRFWGFKKNYPILFWFIFGKMIHDFKIWVWSYSGGYVHFWCPPEGRIPHYAFVLRDIISKSLQFLHLLSNRFDQVISNLETPIVLFVYSWVFERMGRKLPDGFVVCPMPQKKHPASPIRPGNYFSEIYRKSSRVDGKIAWHDQ